jgi:hypothetical protein
MTSSLFQLSKPLACLLSMEIYKIEFDQAVFDTNQKCIAWLQEKEDYNSLLENKFFKLKVTQKSESMGPEPRKVWQWVGQLYKVKQFITERPEPYVMIWRRSGGNYWDTTEMPTPSAKYLRQKADAEQKAREKQLNQIKKATELRRKRKLASKEKKAKSEEGKGAAKEKPTEGGKIKPSKKKRVKIEDKTSAKFSEASETPCSPLGPITNLEEPPAEMLIC